ncbi:MAG: carboxypeptidase regulatory-like domain-containing protein [Verrucomicrobia bacterium]|nr:carboxypeptidase regulatory-like domain-containing protein [Verrucomicrobiota bacterium]
MLSRVVLLLAGREIVPAGGGLAGGSSWLLSARMIGIWSLALSLLAAPRVRATESASQTIRLTSGWNLVSVQVGTSFTPAQFQAAMAQPVRLQQIWGYQPTGNPSVPGSWETFQPLQPPDFPSDVTEIRPGKGYWVKVSMDTTVTITGPRWDGGVSLVPGWNLVGFAGLDLGEDETQDLNSVFGSGLARLQQVWTHDNASKRFSGYDLTAVPALRELNQIRPGQAYWVYALEAVSVQPGPYVILPGDADASPLETEVEFNAAQFPSLPNPADYAGTMIRKVRPGSEDAEFDLNGNGIIDTLFTQSHLKFEVGVDRKVITLGNRGTGIANWVIANDIHWLFTAAPDEKKWPGNKGRPKTASGVVSADRDVVTLFVDRTQLPPGSSHGQITAYVGSLVKTIHLRVEVPTANGDWRGLATTKRVNGREIPIGAVDLGINLFMNSESPSESGFRAILNKDTSLLFPRDVFMNGVFYSGNQFSLTTNFEMPPGDRNVPPFNTFPAKRATNAATPLYQAGADYDHNGDGVLDPSNPFPFPLRRQITLLGQRRSPDFCDGTYIESITGLLPNGQPILVEGTFSLERQNFAPTKRSIFNQATTHAPILIGGTSGTFYRESSINVGSAVSIQGLSLTLGMTFPDPTKLTITLIGPGKTVVLHQGGSTLPTSINLSDYNGQLGQGTWKIRVAWSSTAERGYFNSWGINIQGLATFAVAGKIVGDTNGDSTNEPLAGAQLVLSGSNVIQQLQTEADGTFTIPGLTENTYTLSISRAGFEDRLISFFLNNANLYLYHGTELERARNGGGASTNSSVLTTDPVVLTPLVLANGPELRASPWIGQEDLFVRLSALLSQSSLNQIGGSITSSTWNFGDGSPLVVSTDSPDDAAGDTAATHTFTTPDTYTVTVQVSGPSGSLPTMSRVVHVQRATPDPLMPPSQTAEGSVPPPQVLVAGFVGGFAAPLDNPNVVEVAPGAGTTDQTILVRQSDGHPVSVTLTGIHRGTVWQESKRDTASFDIDREPLIAESNATDFRPGAEDSDFTGQWYVSGDGTATFPFGFRPFDPLDDPASDSSPGTFGSYQPPTVGGEPIPERFRCFVTLGGGVFASRALQSGDFKLQVGRVEP